jgi:hypothetical protein
LFNLKGKPLTLDARAPVEPLFRPHPPQKMLMKGGRQYGKSTSLAYQGTTRSIAIPYFNTVFVTPLYEQIRRFSANYVRPAIDNCILKNYMKEKGRLAENILQRTLRHNMSTMFFSFALRDCERIRGIPADAIIYDEIEGLDFSFLPVIAESMSGSEYRLEQFSGTPLSFANTMERLWQQSSMAEWAIKCEHCGYTSLSGFQFDLLKMLGKEGLVCGKCGKPVNTEQGFWRHNRADRRKDFSGYHMPQSIFPMHCRNPKKWRELLIKRENNFSAFMMECMGESWDVGTKLVSLKDLKAACVLEWDNTWDSFTKNCAHDRHQFRILSIDWSGGGSDEVSLTAMSILGMRTDGRIEVCWMKHYPHTTNWTEDALRVRKVFNEGNCSFLCHDFGGAGVGREQILINAGFPMEKLIPITYVYASGNKALMYYNPPAKNNVRSSYSLDKPRSLIYVCELIKAGHILFPRWETSAKDLEDFVALVEETTQTPRGSDIHLISKAQGLPDDMAHSVNLGVCATYHRIQQWPDISQLITNYSKETLAEMNPDIGSTVEVTI